MKPEKDWLAVEDKNALENSRVLNAIYNGVNKIIFKIINTCTRPNEA